MPNTKGYSLLDVKHAYAAGIVDGEGSVIVYRVKRDDRRHGYVYGGHIAVTSTTKPLILWLQKQFGGSCCNEKTRPGCKLLYRWVLHGLPAANILVNLFPYLIVKKTHAKIYYKFYQSITKWKSKKHGLDRETIEEREELIKEMHELSKGGDRG